MESMDEFIEELGNDTHVVRGMDGATLVENISELISFYKQEIAEERARFEADEQKLVEKIENVRREIKTVEQETKEVKDNIAKADEALSVKPRDVKSFLREETEKIRKEYETHVEDLIDEILKAPVRNEEQFQAVHISNAKKFKEEMNMDEGGSARIRVEVETMRGFIAQMRCAFKDTQVRSGNGQMA